jgi:hypothetical protein
LKNPAIIHSFFFAVFPVVALYAYNARMIPISIREIALPAGLSFANTLVMFF